jgi:plastocyanin
MNRLRAILGLAALAALAVIVAACAGSSTSNSPTVQPSVDPDALTISARDLAFSTNALSAPADEPFQIVFDNQEGAPHNVAIYRDASAAEKVFVEEPFGGPRVVTYNVPALAPGSYFFRCDLHPEMQGSLTVR